MRNVSRTFFLAFFTLFLLSGCSEIINFCASSETKEPLAGNGGELTTGAPTPTSVHLTWSAASDERTASDYLFYRVCRLNYGTISNAADAEVSCANFWETGWSKGLTSIDIGGLFPATTYYLYVLVRDQSGNLGIYNVKTVTTAPAVTASSFYVSSSYTITNDVGATGLSSGDTVTFASGLPGQQMGLAFGTNAFSTLQEAVTAARAYGLASTIFVGEGTYNGAAQYLIDFDTKIIGAGRSVTTLKPGYDTSNVGDARGWFFVPTGKTFEIQNMSLDGIGRSVYFALFSYSPLSVRNVVLSNIHYGTYYGVGIGSYNSTAQVVNSSFSQIGRIGAYYRNSSAPVLYQWNSYSGKGSIDGLDYSAEFASVPNFTVVENECSNVKAAASVDGSTSACFMAYNSLNLLPAPSGIFRGNYAHDSSSTISVGFATYGPIEVTMTENIITTTKGVSTNAANATVTAVNNWWGSGSGPLETVGNPNGTGATITGPGTTTYSPWALTSWFGS